MATNENAPAVATAEALNANGSIKHSKLSGAVNEALAPILDRVDLSHHWICRPGHAPEHVNVALPPEKHGKPYARGACPIHRGESTTRLALFDLDDHDKNLPWPTMAAAAEKISDAAERRGLCSIPWRSSGGHGIHLYMLWDEPQDAYSVRMLLRDVLAEAGFKDGTAGVAAGEAEIFPKQDAVAADRAGSMFVLPGAGKSVPLEPLLGYTPGSEAYWEMSDPVLQRERPVRERSPSTETTADEAELRELLKNWDPARPYQVQDDLGWNDILSIIHHESGGDAWGLELAIEWSEPGWNAASSKYATCAEEIEAKWKSYGHHDNPMTARSLRVSPAASPDKFDDCSAPAGDLIDPHKSRLRQAAEIAADRRAVNWLLRPYLEWGVLALPYGEFDTLKSFLALDLLLHIAAGKDWCGTGFGREPQTVIYVSAEGRQLNRRLRAWAVHHDIKLADVPFYALERQLDLSNKAGVDQLLADIDALDLRPAAVCVDTLSKNKGPLNENAAEDMSTFLNGLRAGLVERYDCTVLVVHHVGHGDKDRTRGSYVIMADTDSHILVERDGMKITVTVKRLKDAEAPAPVVLQAEEVDLGTLDEDGEPETSLVLVPTGEAPVRKKGERKLSDLQQKIYDTACDLAGLEDRVGDVGSLLDTVVDQTAKDPAAPDTRRSSVKRALERMRSRIEVFQDGEKYRVVG